MSKRAKNWLKNLLRWGIAVFGIWYVLSNMSWSNRVLVAGAERLAGCSESSHRIPATKTPRISHHR